MRIIRALLFCLAIPVAGSLAGLLAMTWTKQGPGNLLIMIGIAMLIWVLKSWGSN